MNKLTGTATEVIEFLSNHFQCQNCKSWDTMIVQPYPSPSDSVKAILCNQCHRHCALIPSGEYTLTW